MYILRSIVEEFVKKFHANLTQGYNGVTALVKRLEKEYIIRNVWKIAKKVTKKYPDCQRNKFLKHKPFGEL